MASRLITSLWIDEQKKGNSDFLFFGSKITVDSDCSHELKGCLLLGRKAMTNLDSIKKQRHHFAEKGPSSQSCGFSSSYAGPNRRLSTEELMLSNCCAREDSWESLGWQGDQTKSILKEINSEYSLEGLMLKQKLQSFAHLMWRPDSLEKTLILGKTEGRKRRGWQKMRWLDSITDLVDMSVTVLWGLWRTRKPGVPQSMGSQRVSHSWCWGIEQQQNIKDFYKM